MLTKDQIIKAFARVGEILWQQKKRGEIAVFGGTAIILEYDFRAATQDVHARIDSEHGAIIDAQQQVARELGLPSFWLNEPATSYLSSAADFDLFDTYPDQARPGLIVYVATPRNIYSRRWLNASWPASHCARPSMSFSISSDQRATSGRAALHAGAHPWPMPRSIG